MVKLVAQSTTHALDTVTFGELALFAQIGGPNALVGAHVGKINASPYFITFAGTFHQELSGAGLVPQYTGVVTSIAGKVNGLPDFSLTGLNTSLTELIAAKANTVAVAADIFKGDDTIIGGGLADSIRAYGGNDLIRGGRGGDILLGGTGNDIIDGGLGFDIMWGERGKDTFRFTAKLSAVNVDSIYDFHHLVDEIALSHLIFGKLAPGALHAANFHVGAAAHDADDYIVFNPGNGYLYYDRDGNHALAPVVFASVQQSPGVPATLTVADFHII